MLALCHGHNLALRAAGLTPAKIKTYPQRLPIRSAVTGVFTAGINNENFIGKRIVMLDSCQNVQERWGGVHLLIDRWLRERHELIKAFEALHAEVPAPKAHSAELLGFCQILVDYVSAGHFEVYEQLMAEARAFGDQRGLELAKQIYPRIEAITEAALAFNDRCDNGDSREGECLSSELKRLGQLLHERFELEDCLIEVLHTAHSSQVAQPV